MPNKEIVDYTTINDMPPSYGNQVIRLTDEDIKAIQNGKGVLFEINGGEYLGLIVKED